MGNEHDHISCMKFSRIKTTFSKEKLGICLSMYDTFNISILCIYASYLSDTYKTLLPLLLNKGLLKEYTEVWSESVK